jgi:allantoicase
MGDGWETRRNRDPRHTHDWAIVRLGHPGVISKIEIDTNHYKGNYPDRASLEGCFAPSVIADNLPGMPWETIVPETKMSANKRHFFSAKELQATGPFSHVRLNMFPDGGISRLRVHGTIAR